MEGDEVERSAFAARRVVLAADGVVEEEAEPVAIWSACDLRPADGGVGERAADAVNSVIVEGKVLFLCAVPVGDVGFVPYLYSSAQAHSRKGENQAN